MAMVKCKECGSAVASSANACPHCGVANPSGALSKNPLVRNVVALGVIVVGIYSCSKFMSDVDAPSAPSDDGRGSALVLCQMAIKQTAKNPSSAVVPYARDAGSNGRHIFVWRPGDGLTMMNGFGAKLDTAAVCSTNAAGSRILSLTVDGNDVL